MAAAYGALVSVVQIIRQIEHHPFPPISLDKEQAESLTEVVSFLQEFLEGYNSPFADADEADPLEMRIADAAYAAEDVIESNIVDRILPEFFNCLRSRKEPEADGEKRKINSLELYEGLQKVIDDFDLIKEEAMEIVAEKKKDVVRDQLQRQVSASSSSLIRLDNSSTPSLTRLSSSTDMVGCDDVCLEIMDKLTGGSRDRQLIPIVGMGGIGKTTLARTVYSKPLVKEHFDFCAWATISQQHNKKQILYEILCESKREGEQLSKMREVEGQRLSKMREDELELELELHKYLSHRRFLIVLDDMWSIEAWEKIQHSFPNDNNSSRILVTTRLSNLASQLGSSYCLKMKFLNEVSSWSMFSKIVFEGRDCPVELKKIGNEIVENCRGLPLSIVVMGGLLAKLEPTKKCWESIGKNLNSVVNSENDDRCLKILKTSYDYLPVHLKPCFLYMGVFEDDSLIRVLTLIRLWVSEGFLKPASGGESLETVAKGYLKDLVDRNLILVHKIWSGSTGDVKYCKIHDLLRDLCLREAQKERFYHVLGQDSPHATCSQRRIVIPKSASKKKVLEALESMPRIRSYISERAVVSSLPNLRFLRTLKTYERDVYSGYRHDLRNMFELVNIRYLVGGAHRDLRLPSTINLLWNLQTLIVAHPRKVDAPVEIWKMTQLRHIHFCKQGWYLPSPPSNDNTSTVVMGNLQTLEGVRNFRFDEEMVRRIPNVVRLGLEYDDEKGLGFNGDEYCLSNVKCLSKLESLRYKCSSEAYDNHLHMITFPESLRKLTLDTLTFVWQGVLEKISSLPHLQKLTLLFGQFKGGEWETVEGGFRSLKFLSLVTPDLEKWTMESSSHFPCLERLFLFLKYLEEIPSEIGEIPTLKEITLLECSESAAMSARKIVEEQEELQGEDLPFKVNVTIDKKNQAVQSLANPNFQVECTT